MGKVYAELTDEHREFIGRQKLFFVGSAPLSSEGHVNLSPKGLDSFRVLGPKSVAYLDLTGSGVETIAHVRENGRLTILFCALEGAPRILRLAGRGRVVVPDDADGSNLSGVFPKYTGVRSIVVADLDRIADSCGFGVPRFEFVGERTQLPDWANKKGREGVLLYQAERNRTSIDGLPGIG